MKLFGWKSAGRASARPALARGITSWAQGGWTASEPPRSYEERVRSGYPAAAQHYLSGFVLRPEDRAQWAAIDAAGERAAAREVAAVFIWALPQVMRDGYVHFQTGEAAVEAFDDVHFPMAIGRDARVTEAEGAVLTLAEPLTDRDFAWGRLRWLTGANAGLESRVAANVGTELLLRDPPAVAVEAGGRVELTQGCDKRFATCAARFGNAANFRGEPHLPGNDLLTRYGD